MLKTILILTTDFDHPLIARVHHLVSYLRKRRVNVKVVNIPFEKRRENSPGFVRSFFAFPQEIRMLNRANAVVHLPYMPRRFMGSIGSITNMLQLIFAIVLVRLALRAVKSSAIVAVGPLAGLVANLSYKEGGVIYEDTDLWADLSKGRAQRKVVSLLEFYCLKRAELVISNSEFLHKRACSMNPNSLFISNGVDLSQFMRNRASSVSPSLLYMGSIVEWAGLDLVIEAFSHIAKRNPKIILNICGDGVYRQKLERLVEAEGLSKRILFLGKVPYSKLQELLFSSDLGIAMMKPNTFTLFASPLKVFEYMAAGLPVIATDIGQLGRMVRESGAGLSVNWNTSELVEAMEKLLTDKDLWSKCHTNGLQHVKKYDWNVLFDKWLNEVEKHTASQNR